MRKSDKVFAKGSTHPAGHATAQAPGRDVRPLARKRTVASMSVVSALGQKHEPPANETTAFDLCRAGDDISSALNGRLIFAAKTGYG